MNGFTHRTWTRLPWYVDRFPSVREYMTEKSTVDVYTRFSAPNDVRSVSVSPPNLGQTRSIWRPRFDVGTHKYIPLLRAWETRVVWDILITRRVIKTRGPKEKGPPVNMKSSRSQALGWFFFVYETYTCIQQRAMSLIIIITNIV